MKEWQEEQLQALLSITCEQSLFNVLAKMGRELEFDLCAYGLRASFPVSRPTTVMLSSYPIAWQQRYLEKNYHSNDPTVQHCLRSPLPIIWSDDVFSSSPELWEEARSFGLRFGWAQSSHDMKGVRGMLTLARSHEPITDAEVANKKFWMAWFTQVAHLGMSQCLKGKIASESSAQLTEREIAVLRWTADGKTSGEIAEIVGISERTINFHVNNAVQKLGVSNKMAAAVKAAVLGMIC